MKYHNLPYNRKLTPKQYRAVYVDRRTKVIWHRPTDTRIFTTGYTLDEVLTAKKWTLPDVMWTSRNEILDIKQIVGYSPGD